MGIINRILGNDLVFGDNEVQLKDNTEPELLSKGEFIEERMKGKITRVDPRGFGFISSMDIPYTRIFFHWSGLLQSTRNFKDISKGDWVEFNPFLIDGKGYRALKIAVIDDPNNERD